MIEVVVQNQDVGSILNLVHALRERGWQQGQDFDFAFKQRGGINLTGKVSSETVFTFYQEEYATLFALTYL